MLVYQRVLVLGVLPLNSQHADLKHPEAIFVPELGFVWQRQCVAMPLPFDKPTLREIHQLLNFSPRK